MEILVSQKARKVARIVGASNAVLHGFNVLFAAFVLVSSVLMGFQLYPDGGENLDSYDVDLAPVQMDTVSRMDDENEAFIPEVDEEYTAALLAFSVPQTYGAYLLLQATKLNTLPRIAIPKVNTYLKIQMVYLCFDAVVSIYSIVLQPEVEFDWALVFFLALVLSRIASIHLVYWFRSELQTAATPTDCEKIKTEKEKEKEAEAFANSFAEC